MDIMEFLETNYVWIIVVAVILVMTIIGFIADKHDFGKKEAKEKKNNTKIDPIVEEKPIEEFVGMPVQEPFNESIHSTPVESNPLDSFEMPTDFDSEFTNTVEPVKEEKELKEDLDTTFGDMDTSFVDDVQTELMNKETSKEEQIVLEPKEVLPNGEPNQKLPSVETLNEEIAEVQDDEDVWKF